MEQATEAKEDFTLETLKTPRPSEWVPALKLRALENVGVFTNNVPGENGEVFPSSHPGNGCWQSFHWFISQPLNLTPVLTFCICSVIDGAFFSCYISHQI